jgi:hypothetical protein
MKTFLKKELDQDIFLVRYFQLKACQLKENIE